MSIRTRLGAKRYNDKMDKIFENAKIAKQKASDFYKAIYEHLLKAEIEFCFVESHGLVDRESCLKYIIN